MVRLNIVGPEIEEYLKACKENAVPFDKNLSDQCYGGLVRYYHEDEDRDPDSVRGCFLDLLFAPPNIAMKLAERFYDGDIPYALENFSNDLSDEDLNTFLKEYQAEPRPRADRQYHVVFYGVSGYTGSMIMEYLKRDCQDEDVKIAFAGRTLHKVVATRDKVLGGTKWANVDCFAADLSNAFDVERLVTSCRCVVNVAGPFMLTGGERVVEACIHYDTDYCDVSGEVPWTAKLLEFHDAAWEAGVYIVPSAAYAGGMPDVLTYAVVQEVQKRFGETTRKVHGYVEGGGDAMAPSGGTLETRAAMAKGGKKTKDIMMNPFSLGGSIQNGKREEDQDKVLSKVFCDRTINSWVSPHVYSFFETRVVRRSNYLHHRLVGGPNKGIWYGLRFNFTSYLKAENEAQALDSKASKTSVKAEEEKLKKEGKYYAPGDGPPLEELVASGAFNVMHAVAESHDTNRRVNFSIKGHDGYYETARMVTEMGLMLALDSAKLRTGKKHVRGGLLTPGIAGRDVLLKRLIRSGLGFIDWTDKKMPDAKGYENFNMKQMVIEKSADEEAKE